MGSKPGFFNEDDTRKNTESKVRESEIVLAVEESLNIIKLEFPTFVFSTSKSISTTASVGYINRFQTKNNLDKIDASSFISNSKISPDGGICYVKGKDGFKHIILVSEAKHQGRYDGYTPLSDSAWRKKCKENSKLDPNLPIESRPPQGLGNAVERIFKNSNTIECLTTVYGYMPYVAFCDGYDFHTKDDYSIFCHQPYAKKTDSSIRMRLVTGNKFMPLNHTFVSGIERGASTMYPVSIYARMQKWTHKEMVDVFTDVMRKSINHLIEIEEV